MKKIFGLIGISLFLASLASAQADVFSFCQCKTAARPVGGIATNKFYLNPERCCKNIQCCSTRLKAPPYDWAGGATWVKTTTPLSGWVSNGVLIDSYYITGDSCKTPCKYCQNEPIKWYSTYHTFVTGLAAHTSYPLLYVADSADTIWCFKIEKCNKISPIGKCRLSIPKSYNITGLAFSCDTTKPHPNGVLFVATAMWSPFTMGSTVIYEIPLNQKFCPEPCQPICKVPVKYCKNNQLLGPATGLTYDPCKRTLYVSDLKWTVALNWYPHCKYKTICCCPNKCSNSYTYYYGLGLKSCGCSSSCQTKCTNSYCLFSRNCKKCPTNIACFGSPTLGNNNFGISLSQGYALVNPGTLNFAILWLNFGRCNCKLFNYTSCKFYFCGFGGVPYAIIPYSGRVSGCVFNTNVNLPIPCNPALCCGTGCFQWTVINYNSGNPYTYCMSFSKCLEVKIACQ